MTIANSIRSESHWWQIANLKVSSRSSNNLIESQCQAFFVPRHSLLLIQLTVLLSKIFNRILRQSPDCPKEMTALQTHFSPRYNYVFYIAVRRLSKLVTSLRNLHCDGNWADECHMTSWISFLDAMWTASYILVSTQYYLRSLSTSMPCHRKCKVATNSSLSKIILFNVVCIGTAH